MATNRVSFSEHGYSFSFRIIIRLIELFYSFLRKILFDRIDYISIEEVYSIFDLTENHKWKTFWITNTILKKQSQKVKKPTVIDSDKVKVFSYFVVWVWRMQSSTWGLAPKPMRRRRPINIPRNTIESWMTQKIKLGQKRKLALNVFSLKYFQFVQGKTNV